MDGYENNQLEVWKARIILQKKNINGMNNLRLKIVEERIRKLEDRTEKFTQNKAYRNKEVSYVFKHKISDTKHE